jgi:cobalamin biosynthesis protein CobW
MERIPALVVSGFLGSGKTTLVRHLLRDAQSRGERVAVISNEFGELGIDQALLGEGEEAYVELEGGCVCCKLSDELRDTLQMLWEKVKPEKIIVETSGVALPYDTQLNFWRPPVNAWIDDDMAAVVVNAEQLRNKVELEGTFEDQVSSADLLVLNKCDLVPVDSLDALEAELKKLAPDTPIVRCTQGILPPDLLFTPDPIRFAKRDRDRGPQPHSHAQFESEERRFGPMDGATLIATLRELGALRAKGFVETEAGIQLVQGVGRRIELSDAPPNLSPDFVGRVVIIRRGKGSPSQHD